MKGTYINIDVYNNGLYLTFVCQSGNTTKKMVFPRDYQDDVIQSVSGFMGQNMIGKGVMFGNKMNVKFKIEIHDVDLT